MMEREIKFRAWTGLKFIYRGLHDRNWYTEDLGGKLVKTTHPDDKQMPVMQYTGLKDKNGVDIYEGDILEFKNTLGKCNLHKVFYANGGLVVNSHNDDLKKDYTPFYEACADMQTSGYINQCKIIGNIHQKPELLK